MKPFNLIAGKAQAAIAVALLVGAGLSGCGSSNDDDHGNNGDGGGGGSPSTPAPVTDVFFSTVSSFISASSDSTEDNAIDVFVTTSPENTEPEPLG